MADMVVEQLEDLICQRSHTTSSFLFHFSKPSLNLARGNA